MACIDMSGREMRDLTVHINLNNKWNKLKPALHSQIPVLRKQKAQHFLDWTIVGFKIWTLIKIEVMMANQQLTNECDTLWGQTLRN